MKKDDWKKIKKKKNDDYSKKRRVRMWCFLLEDKEKPKKIFEKLEKRLLKSFEKQKNFWTNLKNDQSKKTDKR